MCKSILGCGTVLAAAFTLSTAAPASAGFYKNIDVLDDSFDDWNDVPVLTNDPSGDGNPIDLNTVQIANDEDYLYLRITYHTAVNPNASPSVFLAFDTDNNVATGFNIYGLGAVGSDAAFQNDFPFDQRTDYNAGGLSAPAGIAPYFAVTTSQEYRIRRDLTYTNDDVSVFGDSFTLMVWTGDADGATADATEGIFYEFAPVPEPAALSLLALGGLGLLRRRRA